jgi:hypothetical protein
MRLLAERNPRHCLLVRRRGRTCPRFSPAQSICILYTGLANRGASRLAPIHIAILTQDL